MEAIIHCDFFFIVFWEDVSAFNTFKEKATLTLSSFSFHIFLRHESTNGNLILVSAFELAIHDSNIKTGIKEIMIKKKLAVQN